MKKIIGILIVIIVLLIVSLLAKSYFFATNKSQQSVRMKITSPAFENHEKIPEKYTCAGKGFNPPLFFSEVPSNTKSLVLIMDDPDAPMGTFVHWVIYNMKLSVTGITENTKPQGTEGKNGVGQVAYVGPCPPSGTHHYYFKLYALDIMLTNVQSLDKKMVEAEMQGHILDQAELVGLFSKQ